ncbi:MAG: hypothetical protein DRR06_05705 [Gammaproteobacteria bacterium]|nr:MAG: hypothetical protein DRR06_05705 [Gammaproteobacteria bacterium]
MTQIRKLVTITGLFATLRAALIAALVVSLPAFSASAQNKSSNYEPARNAQGHPNIQGIWDFRTLTPLERPKTLGDKATFTAEEQEAFKEKAIDATDVDKLREHAAAEQDIEGAYNNFWMDYGTTMNEDRRTSLIVDPPNGRLPALTPEAMAGLKKNLSRNPPVRDIVSIGLEMATFRPEGPETLGLSERCLLSFNAGPPLIPSAYNNNLRIVQTPNYVVIFTEMIHDARIVPIDGRPHLPAEMEKWTGDSRGHWDGDTLVIETTNFTDKTPSFQLPLNLNELEMNGVVGSGRNMKLTERFTPISESRLVYEYTVNDPGTFTRPFTVAIPLRATEDQIFEYACHEGNHAMAGMLKGARQAEKEEANAAL